MEYIESLRKEIKGDWIRVFQKALEIYRGKIKGFSNVPEVREIREETMKAELKLLIKRIIS